MKRLMVLCGTMALSVGCATKYDVTMIQTQIDGLQGQLSRTKEVVDAASETSKRAEASASQAAESAALAAEYTEKINTRLGETLQH